MSILAIRSNRRPEIERLKNYKIAEFESDRSLLASKDVALQSCENLQTFVWLWTIFCTPPPPPPTTTTQTSVQFREFWEAASL